MGTTMDTQDTVRPVYIDHAAGEAVRVRTLGWGVQIDWVCEQAERWGLVVEVHCKGQLLLRQRARFPQDYPNIYLLVREDGSFGIRVWQQNATVMQLLAISTTLQDLLNAGWVERQ